MTVGARWLLAILLAAMGCAESSLGPTSGVDGGVGIGSLSESDARQLCAWSIESLGGSGTDYRAPCVADAPVGTTIEMVVVSVPECTRRLFEYEHDAYFVADFEDCTREFKAGRCGGGCISFSIDYPEDAEVFYPPSDD